MGGRAAAMLLMCASGVTGVAAQELRPDIVRYQFRLTIPDTGSSIRSEAVVSFRNLVGDTLQLDLVGMTVDRVQQRVAPELQPDVPYVYDGKLLKITKAPGYAGSDGAFVITYHGVPQDGLLLRTSARGRRVAFADNWPERARYWIPTLDHPRDKAQVDFGVTAPRGWKLVANGTRHPIPTYTMVLGAGEFAVSHHRPVIHGRDSIPIEAWTYPEDSAYADSVPFRRATEIVETMERLVGPFPYEKLAHVQSSTRYGGMENSGAIFYAEQPYVDRTMREGVVRHETAHQWFGDAVTAREWPHLWLSEGFASYFDHVIGAALDGDSVLARGMRRSAESYFASSVVDRPLVDTAEHDPMRLLNANSYQKGAWVLHMLRGLVGDSTFFRGIREYYRVYRDSTAVSEDFQRVMEQSAGGRRLGWFFRQWLWQPGHPRLTVRWRYEPAERRVRLDLTQVQPDAWGGFRLPRVEVEAVTAGAKRVRRVFSMDARTIIAYVELDEAPVEVRADPDGRLLLTTTPVPQ